MALNFSFLFFSLSFLFLDVTEVTGFSHEGLKNNANLKCQALLKNLAVQNTEIFRIVVGPQKVLSTKFYLDSNRVFLMFF